ncbi:MAG TPA: GAF domain-containing protein, partial [Holophagaceae bacterium]
VDARSSGFRRAYACLPIDHQGARFGLLFVNFSEPHPFPDTERRLLSTFARQLGIALDNAHLHQQLRLALDQVKTLSGLIPICSYCSRIRSDEGYWQRVEAYIRERTEAQFTHGICPDCFERAKQEIAGSVGSGAHGLSHR